MKNIFLIALAVVSFGFMACSGPNFATIKIYNDNDLPVPFNLSYKSNVVDTSGIESYAPKEYQIDVYPKGDKVSATVWKTSLDQNELKIELYYNGKLQDMEKTSSILLPAYVEFTIE
ncbi:hypothetical protein GX441_05585 [bacterium]|nr:hypothetical protein [bacterium]